MTLADGISFSFDQGGETMSVSLTPEEAEALGLRLIRQSHAHRPRDDRPLQQRSPLLVMDEPPTDLRFERDGAGAESIAIVCKPADLPPLWIWYDQEDAIRLAHAILNIAGGISAKPLRRRS